MTAVRDQPAARWRTLVVDTGPLVAAADSSDAHHARCAELLQSWPGALVVPQLVVTETTCLLARNLGTRSELLFLAELASGGLSTEPVAPADWLRIAELVAHYRDFPLGTADASVVTCAERLDVTTVATLDRRHFGAVRPAHAAAFELLP